MSLVLYCRHRRDCKACHPEESRTSEYDERKKGWKRCECPIFVSCTLNKLFKRHNTGQWEWESAHPIARSIEADRSWDVNLSALPPVQLGEPAKQSSISITDASKVFLTNREGAKIAPATLRKYRTFTKQLAAFAGALGYLMLDQFTSADIDVFHSGWKLRPRTKGKTLGTLRAFSASP